MIDLNELVYALNEYLGRDKYILYLGTNGAPDKQETRIVGTVNVGCVPYAFSTAEIDAESLNVTFTFDLPCGTKDDDLKRDLAIAEIAKKLIAWKKIAIDYVNGDRYFLNTYFEMLPMSNPYVDCGRITQQLVVAGKALMQNEKCGAVIGNNELVIINAGNVSGNLLVIDKASATSITHDAKMPLSDDVYIPELEVIALSNTLKVTCLYLGTDLDKHFWSIGEGAISEPNKVYTVTTMLRDVDGAITSTHEKKCKVISVTNSSGAGVFNRYEITLQMVNA
jgi:hypothetical protein